MSAAQKTQHMLRKTDIFKYVHTHTKSKTHTVNVRHKRSRTLVFCNLEPVPNPNTLCVLLGATVFSSGCNTDSMEFRCVYPVPADLVSSAALYPAFHSRVAGKSTSVCLSYSAAGRPAPACGRVTTIEKDRGGKRGRRVCVRLCAHVFARLCSVHSRCHHAIITVSIGDTAEEKVSVGMAENDARITDDAPKLLFA
jgi:hypothetical protein